MPVNCDDMTAEAVILLVNEFSSTELICFCVALAVRNPSGTASKRDPGATWRNEHAAHVLGFKFSPLYFL